MLPPPCELPCCRKSSVRTLLPAHGGGQANTLRNSTSRAVLGDDTFLSSHLSSRAQRRICFSLASSSCSRGLQTAGLGSAPHHGERSASAVPMSGPCRPLIRYPSEANLSVI